MTMINQGNGPAIDQVKLESLGPQQRHALIQRGEAIIRSDPANSQMLVQLGSLYMAERNYDEAIKHLLSAYKVNRKDQEALAQLVTVYNIMSLHKEAKKYARKLSQLQPRNIDYQTVYAQTLEFCQSFTSALEIWTKLARMHPENLELLHEQANCLRMMGRMEQSNAVLRKILDKDPQHADALYLYTNSMRLDEDEARALLPEMRASFEKQTEAVLKANLGYACGKVLTDIGETDEAFDYYVKANQLRETKEQEEYHWIDNIRAGYSPAVFQSKAGYGNQSTAPIFIVGMVRSGTTLTESLIGAHSKVSAGDELPYMQRMSRSMGQFTAQPEAFADFLSSLSKKNFNEMASLYLDATRELRKKTPHFTDKMPHNFQSLGLIRLIFPNAKIIHCRRHPVDNCLSIFTNSMIESHNKYKNNLPSLGLYYRQYLRLMSYWRDNLPGGFHEVCYEDLVTNTQAATYDMLEYLGLEQEKTDEKRSESQKGVRTLSAWQVRQPIFSSSMGRWRKFEKHLGPLLETLGSCVEEYENEIAQLAKANG